MTKKQPLCHRIKSAILGWATGRILPRVMLAATAAVAAAVMQGYGKLADAIPGLAEIIDPQLVVDLSAQFVVAFVLLLLSRWTGKPVRDWQQKLDDAGVYSGRNDGWLGPRTDDALRRSINDRHIISVDGALTDNRMKQPPTMD